MNRMIKVDIFSGFLGAGKTTLIKKLIEEGYKGEKIVLIENEFGEIGIDGGFLKDSGIQINEMNSGCICCSLVGDFGKALIQVIEEFSPERILIEPSGVGKLSDIIEAVKRLDIENVELNVFATVVDATKAKRYMKNFGEFFNNQIENAGAIILSHTQKLTDEKLDSTIEIIKEHNPNATIITTPWEKLSGEQILKTIERNNTIESMIDHMTEEHHHHHDESCCCGDEHHDHDDDCYCGEEHHEHSEDCCCGHDHDHNHHHADEIFDSIGTMTTKKFAIEDLKKALEAFEDENTYGFVLRAKGIVRSENEDEWIYFDYVPGEIDIRKGKPDVTGKLCIIGYKMKKDKIKELFGV